MSSMLDDDDDRSAISSLILTPTGQHSPREDVVTTKLVKFDVSISTFPCMTPLQITLKLLSS